MYRLCWGLALIISFANAQNSVAPPQLLSIRAGRLLDVITGKYIQNPVVVIEGTRIRSIAERGKIPPASKVVDLGSATLLPGFIDAHTHLLFSWDPALPLSAPMLLIVAQMSTAKRALLGVKNGREDLEAGITTVRDLGNSGVNGDVALRDAIASGWVTGPRVIASTRALTPTGGQGFGALAQEAQTLIQLEYAVVSGPEEARKAVRQALYDGADCIKVIVNDGRRVLASDEMEAIVTEAHRAGKKVAAHAVGDLPTRVAAEAGVDSIEHAWFVPDDVLKTMAQKKIFLVPTDPDVEDNDSLMRSANVPNPKDFEARRIQSNVSFRQPCVNQMR